MAVFCGPQAAFHGETDRTAGASFCPNLPRVSQLPEDVGGKRAFAGAHVLLRDSVAFKLEAELTEAARVRGTHDVLRGRLCGGRREQPGQGSSPAAS